MAIPENPDPADPGRRSFLRWREIPASVWMLGLVSLLMDVSSEMIHALLPVFLVTVLGASAVMVGLIGDISGGRGLHCDRLLLCVCADGSAEQAGVRSCGSVFDHHRVLDWSAQRERLCS